MRIRRPDALLRLVTAGSLLALSASVAPAAGAAPPPAAGGTALTAIESTITVAGTSNLHDWTVEAAGMEVSFTLPAGFLDGTRGTAPTGRFALPAKALRSDKDRMNTLMWEALEADEHPEMVFEMRGAEVEGTAGGALQVEVTGVLTVAGVGRPTTMTLSVRRQGTRLLVQGELPLKMTELGIKPPTAMLGTLKTGDRVVVTLEATLGPAGG